MNNEQPINQSDIKKVFGKDAEIANWPMAILGETQYMVKLNLKPETSDIARDAIKKAGYINYGIEVAKDTSGKDALFLVLPKKINDSVREEEFLKVFNLVKSLGATVGSPKPQVTTTQKVAEEVTKGAHGEPGGDTAVGEAPLRKTIRTGNVNDGWYL